MTTLANCERQAPGSEDALRDPLVSVVMIFLNGQPFIEEAVESVLTQTYRNWELLLVDDGSSDGSTELTQRYAAEDPGRVRYLCHAEHANRGMSVSRNVGIKAAHGLYLAFLDADDAWLPQKLQQQVALLEAHREAGMVYGPAEYWYSWNDEPLDRQNDSIQDVSVQLDTLIQPPQLLTLFLKREDVTPSPSGILVRRALLDDVGGFEESFRGMHEDQAFYAKACLNSPVYVSGQTWYRYRQHANSCCADAVRRGKADAARLTFWNWLARYLTRQRAVSGEPWKIVHRLLEPERRPFRHRARLMFALAKRVVRRVLRRGREGRLSWGSLRRGEPISRVFGADRGQSVDRSFIERFLSQHEVDIHGHVLEIGDDTYTRRFGGTRVTRRSVLHAEPGNPRATLVGNLETGDGVPSDTFDCVILTQTLQHTYDVRAAVESVYRCLRPGGVVLATVPGISQISRYDMDRWGDFWRFTTLSAGRLFGDVFGQEHVEIVSCGSVLTAIAHLHGIAAQELRADELDHDDQDYQVLITIRAVKRPRT